MHEKYKTDEKPATLWSRRAILHLIPFFKKMTFCLTFLVCLMLSQTAFAAVYYVAPSGAALWSECVDIGNPCSLATANTHASAGDTVYLRGGLYPLSTLYGTHLNPKNSGHAAAWIVFRNYPGETPQLKGTYGTRMWGLIIQNTGYIKIEGLSFADYSDYLIRAGAHHIEVKDCIFKNETSPYREGSFQIVEACVGGDGFTCPVNNIWIHGNTFYKLAAGGGCSDGRISEGGDSFRIGYYSLTCVNGQNCAQGQNRNITVENNYMAYGGHAVMDSYSVKSVFRNNVAHNEPWYPADNGTCTVAYEPSFYENPGYNGLYSHRIWGFTDTYAGAYRQNLIESNRLGHSGVNPNNDGSTALALASPGNIVRYNALYDSMNNNFKYKFGANYGWQASGGINNRVYNNTLYRNGYGYPYFQTCTTGQLSTCPKAMFNLRYYAAHDEPGNVAINNIVYGGYGTVVKGNADIQPNTSGSVAANNFCTKEDVACSAYGDPKFVNPDLTQTASLVLPDLHLQSSSPAIDAGTHLTETAGAGVNSTTLMVRDARYFQDGSWGADVSDIQPDWIAVGDVNHSVQISSIDYDTHTIQLSSPISWNNNAPVWLYKKSDGTRVLIGAAPDMGAYEFGNASPPAAPAGLTVN